MQHLSRHGQGRGRQHVRPPVLLAVHTPVDERVPEHVSRVQIVNQQGKSHSTVRPWWQQGRSKVGGAHANCLAIKCKQNSSFHSAEKRRHRDRPASAPNRNSRRVSRALPATVASTCRSALGRSRLGFSRRRSTLATFAGIHRTKTRASLTRISFCRRFSCTLPSSLWLGWFWLKEIKTKTKFDNQLVGMLCDNKRLFFIFWLVRLPLTKMQRTQICI